MRTSKEDTMSRQSLVPWRWGHLGRPWGFDKDEPWGALERRMDRFFEDVERHVGLPWFPSEAYGPHVDVAEDETEVKVTAELPGLKATDVEVSLLNNMLMIRGQRSDEKEEKHQHYHRRERSFGTFSRSILLPCDVDEEKIRATFKDGLLTVTLAKPETAQRKARQISIRET